MAALDLTEEEHDFLSECQGSIWSILDGTDSGPVGEARTTVAAVVKKLLDAYPNRIQRLLIYAALADNMGREREALVKSILRDSIRWVDAGDDDWRCMALETYEATWLATVAGVSGRTIRAWWKKIAYEMLDEAKAKAAT